VKENLDLFSDSPGASLPAAQGVVALKIPAGSTRLSVAQKRFNSLMASIEKMRGEIESIGRVLDARRPAHVAERGRLAAEAQALQMEMLVLLDQRLQAKGLTATQKRQTREILLNLYDQLAGQLGDAELAALAPIIARYRSADDLAALAEDEALAMEEAKAMFADMFGTELPADEALETPEDLMAALARQMQREHEAEAARREVRKAKRKPSARALAAEQQQQDAQGALRTIYRQLAASLHPDREPDAAERQRKTALMSEVNAAYERRDLTALLRMQLQIAQVDTSQLAALADDKLKAMNRLLEEQKEALRHDRLQLAFELEADFGLPRHVAWSEQALLRAMREQIGELKSLAEWMRSDLQVAQDDARFKGWLKEQVRAMNEIDRDAALMDAELVFLMGQGRRRR